MKVPVLSTIRQVYLRQMNTQYSRLNPGFTILEVITVALIIGILSAIAVPGWNAFINNQRTRTVNDSVFRALRSAQGDAKLKKKDITVTFKYNKYPPVVSINNIDQTLNANGEIKAGIVELATGECAADDCSNGFTTDTNTNIIFNNQGIIENDDSLPFAITTAIAEGKGAKRCVIVQTILGNMRTAEGDQCPQPDDW
ncbi:MAG: type II secretion system GspH family protein [Trichodesmium sp. MAG_R02]|jgi:prepilin-type N-terminal cleavage/methylation domain-containing protein|nr:type II secretion system GspH family protein [Trichodesmium sp. MAG_R02]